MATLTFDDLPEAKSKLTFDDLPAASAAPTLTFDDLPDAPAQTPAAPVATPSDAALVRSTDGSGAPPGTAPAPGEPPVTRGFKPSAAKVEEMLAESAARNASKPSVAPEDAAIAQQAQAEGRSVIMQDGRPTLGPKIGVEAPSGAEKIRNSIGEGFATSPEAMRQMFDYAGLAFYRQIDPIIGTNYANDLYGKRLDITAKAAQELRAGAKESGLTNEGFVGDTSRAIGQQIPLLPLQLGVAASAGLKGALAASAAFGGLQSASGSFASNVAERTAKGESLESASNAEFVPSVASGLITAAVTTAFGNTGIESIFKEKGAKAAASKLFETLKEGGFEVAEEMIDEGGQIVNDLVNGKKVTAEEALKRVGTAAVVASIMGTGTVGLKLAMEEPDAPIAPAAEPSATPPPVPAPVAEATSALTASAGAAAETLPAAAQEAALLAEAINAKAAADAARAAATPLTEAAPNEPQPKEAAVSPEPEIRQDVPEQRSVPVVPEQPPAPTQEIAPEVTTPAGNISDDRLSELEALLADEPAVTPPSAETRQQEPPSSGITAETPAAAAISEPVAGEPVVGGQPAAEAATTETAPEASAPLAQSQPVPAAAPTAPSIAANPDTLAEPATSAAESQPTPEADTNGAGDATATRAPAVAAPLENRLRQPSSSLSDDEIRGLSKAQRKERTSLLQSARREAQAKVDRLSKVQNPDRNQRRVLARATASRDAAVEALTDLERVQPPAPVKRRTFAVADTGDTFMLDPVVQVIMENGGLVSKSTARKKWDADKFEKDKGSWDDAPQRFDHPTHNAIYKEGGRSPDDAVSDVIDAGLLPEGSTPADLWRIIKDASRGGKAARDATVQQKASVKSAEQQAKAFEQSALSPQEGETATPISDLEKGDEIIVDGERVIVTDIDPDTGAVTLKDGTKFGVQTIEEGRVFYDEVIESQTDVFSDWPEIDTPLTPEEYAVEEGLLNESQRPDRPPAEKPQAPDTEGARRPAEDAGQGSGAASQEVAETPLEKARRVLALREQEQIAAREEGDYELAASLNRVLPKLRKDLAALEAKAAEPAPEVAPVPEKTEPVEMWQRTRDQVGTMLAKHREVVRDAVKAGKPVPDEVLAEYSGSAWADKEILKRSREAKKQAVAKVDETPKPEATEESEPEGIFSIYKRGDRWMMQMSADKRGFGDGIFDTREDAERIQKIERANAESRAESLRKIAEQEKADSQAKAEREDLDGFDKDMSPMKRGSVVKQLTTRLNYRGTEMTRRDLIRKMVAEGRRIETEEGQRVLSNEKGEYLGENVLTKAGLDYAEFLVSKSNPLPQLRKGKAADDLLQGENDVFNLVSETAADKAAREKREQAEEAAKAAKEAAEAKALQDKQQANLFDAPTETKAEPKPDKIESFLDKAIEDLKTKPGEFFSDPLFIQSVGKPALRAALQIVRAAYKGGKTAIQAIEDGIAYLKANVANLDEAKAREFFMQAYEPTPTPAPEPAAQPTVEPSTATPPPAPPAPASTSEEPSPTGIRNAIVDRERVARGLPERMAPLRRTFARLWDEAMARVDADPNAGTKLVNEIAETPRPLEDWESALLAHEQVTRQNAFDKAVEAVNANPGDPQAASNLADARAAVQEIYDAGQRVGTESGRSLAARKLLVNEDYSLAKMESVWRAEVNGGQPLTADQAKEIAALHERIAAAEAKLKEFEEKEAQAEAKRVFDQVLEESRKEAKKEVAAEKSKGGTLTKWLERKEQEAIAALSSGGKFMLRKLGAQSGAIGDVGGRGGSGKKLGEGNLAELHPQDVLHLTVIGAARIAKGVTKIGDWTASMLADFGDAVKPYIKPLFDLSKKHYAEDRKTWETTAKTPKPAEIEKTTAPATPESVLESAKPGEPLDPRLVFNLARAHVNAGVEGMEAVMAAVHADLEPLHEGLTIRDVRDAFSGYGKVTYPSKEADLTALREYRTLARLTSQLEDAQRRIAPLKTGPQRDKATQKVRDLTKQVKETMRRLGIETTTPEQQLKTSLDAVKTRLQNQIEDLNKQIATKTKPEGKTPIPYDDEAKALKAERDRLASIAQEIFGKPQLTDEQRIAAANKALDAAIAEEDQMLKDGILKRPAKESKTPLTPELESKRAMLDAMRDLRRELANAENPKKSPEERALEAAFKAARASLERYDAMLKSGDLTPAARAAKFTPTGELETLWNERNAVRDAVAELRRAAIPRKPAEEIARQAALKALDKRIAELDRRLKEGDFSEAPARAGKAAQFADVQAKRAERDAMMSLYRTLKKAQLPQRTEEQIALARSKKLIAARTAELQRRVKEGDYAPKPKKDPVMDAEKEKLLFENAKAKEAFLRAKYLSEMKNRPPMAKLWGNIKDTLGIFRALKVGFDNSAIGRQGRWVAESHPILAMKALPDNFRAAFSEKQAFAAFERIKNDPAYQDAVRAKVSFVDPNEVSLNKIEEEYQSRWINSLPRWTIVGPGLRASQRAFNAYMNKARLEMFKSMRRIHESAFGVPPTAEQTRNYGKMTNVATGRGEMGRYEANVQAANMFLFATRFYVSRVQALLGQPMWKADNRTRAIIASEYARMLMGKAFYYAVVLGMLRGIGGDEEEDIVWNPLSSNFGKIKSGNTYIDPWAGEAQWLTVMSRMAMGKKIDYKGREVNLRGKTGFAKADIDGTVLRFLETKRSPNFALIHDFIRQKHYMDKEWTPESALEQAVSPLLLRDTYQLLQEHGVPKGTALWLLLLHGESMQTRTDD